MEVPQRRNYALALLLGAAGAALALLAVRQGWARAVYAAPRPLPSQSITVSGQDVAPAAGALALAGLACLAAIIATRGVARRAAGVVLALCGAGTAVAVSGSLGASRVIAAAATKVSSSASVASGGAGSTTGGTSSPGGAVVTGGSSAHVVMLGVPWRVAVFAGAAAIIASGLLTAWRGARWPVMSGRYERPAERPGGRPAGAARPSPAGRASRAGSGASSAAPVPPAIGNLTLDPASLWDSISRGEDPTESLRGPGSPG
ncbi:MAG: Trp biosynthesis-associated membrane protein [Streptosporangiaceae bacterium]